MLYMLFFLLLINWTTSFVLISKNAIESVLFLMLVFVFSSFLFLLLGAEFLAILIIIIYVGAISILFLFIVMMLNLRVVELHTNFFNYFPISSIFFSFVFINLIYFLFFDYGIVLVSFEYINIFLENWSVFIGSHSNLFLIGVVLYKYNAILVFLAAILLLVAMIGTIVLTIDTDIKKISRKKQYLYFECNFIFRAIYLYII